MVEKGEAVINSHSLQPRLRSENNAYSKEKFAEDIQHAYSSSSGIVVCYKEGTGEVITQETFDDIGLHFVFTKKTLIQNMYDYDTLGIGSVVQIYWSRSFERIMKGSHIVINIERMDVYKCSQLHKERIFVTFNSHSLAGVAIGVTERNMMVSFHPNSSPGIRYETLRALHGARTEFQLPCEHKFHENTNRMVLVTVAYAPFKVEINGNIEKIPYIVVRKHEDLSGFEGPAIVSKVVKNLFMEAIFISTSDIVFFDSNACHSNVLDKVSVGSFISVLASPTFPNSCFKWYGYDVTLIRNVLFEDLNRINLSSFKTYGKVESNAGHTETTYIQSKNNRKSNATMRPKKRSSLNCSTFDVTRAQYKRSHVLLDRCRREKLEDLVSTTRSCGFNPIYGNRLIAKDTFHMKISNSLRESIENALEHHGLRKAPILTTTNHPAKVIQLDENEIEDISQIREKFGDLIDSDGYALDQKVTRRFVLPDTAWKHNEKRIIGVHDDIQWMLMATFCQSQSKNSTEGHEMNSPLLLGGWWYRRAVPRDAPVAIVKELNAKRNVLIDCGL